jgi:hypothetical protein
VSSKYLEVAVRKPKVKTANTIGNIGWNAPFANDNDAANGWFQGFM